MWHAGTANILSSGVRRSGGLDCTIGQSNMKKSEGGKAGHMAGRHLESLREGRITCCLLEHGCSQASAFVHLQRACARRSY